MNRSGAVYADAAALGMALVCLGRAIGGSQLNIMEASLALALADALFNGSESPNSEEWRPDSSNSWNWPSLSQTRGTEAKP